MAKAVKPTIRFAADFDAYKRELKTALRQTDKFDRSLKGAGKRNGFKAIGKSALGAAAGIGAVALAGNELKRSVEETVNLAKATRQLQRATGLASEDASQLAAVLKVRNIGTDKAGRSFTSLARQIEAAKTGTGAAADQFRKLGVSQKTLASGNFNQILLGISDGFQKLGDGTAKATAAQALFGRNSRDILPLLEGGSAKLREQLGLAPRLSEAQKKQALEMVNAQRQVNLALMNVRVTLGTALLPYLSKAANAIAEFVTGMKNGTGKGGEFAKKVKEIWAAIKPAAEQLWKFAKRVFEFAAANPQLVKIAASMAAVGLAIKAIRFGSAVSGLSTFLSTAKGLGAPLKKLFSKFGTRAGGAFAAEASGNMAGNMAGSLAPSGTLGKMGGEKGKFAKWGGRMGRAAKWAFIAAFTYLMVKELGDKMGGWLDDLLSKFGVGPNDPHGDRSGQDLSAPRTVKPGDMPGKIKRRSGPRAKGSSVGGMRYPGGRGQTPEGKWLASYGNDPAAALVLAEQRAAAAQTRLDSLTNATSGRKKSRTEAQTLRELKRLAKEAQKEVEKLQFQLGRRDALADISESFRNFAQGMADAYSQGLERIQQARLSAAQKVSQQILDDQLKNLDEEEGQSEEARRLRELRAQQEADQKAREDQDYADNKKLLEDELARAIRNGNTRRQEELNQSILDLDTQRRDLLRSREIQDLSDSLARQRKVAQDEYEARNKAAQDYYDAQVIINAQLVTDYKARVQEQMDALYAQLEAGKLSYTEYNTKVNELAGVLTALLKADLDARATNEKESLKTSLGKYATYVTDINKEFDRVMDTLPAPEIPKIPQITIDVFYNYINPPAGTPEASTPAPAAPAADNRQPVSALKSFLRHEQNKDPKNTYKPLGSYLAGKFKFDNLAAVMKWERENKDWLKKEKVDIQNRASGGMLSRSALTMVGETGPELIMGGRVISATRSNRMDHGNVTLNVYPQTTADDPVALARALGWQLATR